MPHISIVKARGLCSREPRQHEGRGDRARVLFPVAAILIWIGEMPRGSTLSVTFHTSRASSCRVVTFR